jgi:hypothetical protein
MAANVSGAATIAAASALFGPVDGFLGMEALREVAIELDFPKKQMQVVKAGVEAYPEERGMVYRGGLPRGELEIAGRSVAVALHSVGTGGFELPMIDELPLLHPATKIDAVGAGRLAERTVRGQLAGEARFGPVTWVRPPITRRPLARVGLVALSQWRIAIDQPNRKIYFLDGNLRRVANEVPPPAPEARAGYFGFLDSGLIRLKEVDEGGAFARGGLRPGDAIVSVDGVAAAEYVRRPGLFSARSNPRPKLWVQRDGAEFEAELGLGAPGEAARENLVPR